MNKELLNQLSDAVEFLNEFQQRTFSLTTEAAKIDDWNLAIDRKKETLDQFKNDLLQEEGTFTQSETVKYYLPTIITFLLLGPIGLIVGFVQLCRIHGAKVKKGKKMLKTIYPSKEKEFLDFKEERNKETNKFIAENGYCVAFLPARYRLDSYAVDYMYRLVSEFRADTLKEAINLYESELREMQFRQEVSDKLAEMEHNRSLEAEYFASALEKSIACQEKITYNQEKINDNLIEIRDKIKSE